MFTTFAAKAEAVSAQVLRVGTKGEALELVLDQLKAEGVADRPGCYAVWAGCPFLEGLDTAALAAAVPGLRFDVTRETAAASRVGISQMEWAIADTGTVAQNASAVDQRLVSTLSTTHIAFVPSDRLVPDLASFLTVLPPATADYIALITGPSRTADIERVLTIGVHGPERLVIIFVDDLGDLR
jgi:L-lactate dehydrogenase complex protein LldG